MKFRGKVTQWDCISCTFKVSTQVGSIIITSHNDLVIDTLVDAMRRKVNVVIETEEWHDE